MNARDARDEKNVAADFQGWNCPAPLRDYPHVILGHGGGGKLSSELIEHIFLPAFANDHLARLADATVVDFAGGRLAMSTDSYVVRPLFFPGGSIGVLAVNGTVNDLAMSGARPLYISAGFIIEEGMSIAQLNQTAEEMGAAARRAGVAIIAGDTKVVEKGHGDGCYINTTGIGVVSAQLDIAASNARAGDVVILSGTIGDHGMAIMSVREGLEFEADIKSDTAPLHELVADVLSVCPEVHVLRDPTRGGLSASLNEIASASNRGIVIEENKLPVNRTVQNACEILGLDPLLVANEGKLVCIAPGQYASTILAAMKSNEFGANAAVIGTVVDNHAGMVVAKTSIGGSRVISVPMGEQLPRIC